METTDAPSASPPVPIELPVPPANSQGDQPGVDASWTELCVGIAALLLWFALFTGGILIGTKSHIDAFSEIGDFWSNLYHATVIILFWTISNVGFLACLAAVLGAFAYRTRFTTHPIGQVGQQLVADAGTQERHRREVFVYYSSAVIRGFGVYSLVQSGLLVLTTDMLTNPSPEKYVRLAATISVVSFYAGYDPELFGSLMGRIKKLIDGK